MNILGIVYYLFIIWQFVSGSYIYDYTVNPSVGIEYKFHSQPKSWWDAYLTCINENATLAFPRIKDEVKALVEMMDDFYLITRDKNIVTEYIQLGFHDKFRRLDWVTVNDESVSDLIDFWKADEPVLENDNERCGGLHFTGGLSGVDCFKTVKQFICERRIRNIYRPYNHDAQYFYDKNSPSKVRRFKVHGNIRRLSEARAICQNEGGNLVKVKTMDEFKFVQNMFRNVLERSWRRTDEDTKYYSYTDFTDVFKHGEYFSSTGERIQKYLNIWNSKGNGGCVVIGSTGSGYSEVDCTTPHFFICEREFLEAE